jgi:hypothetical protein
MEKGKAKKATLNEWPLQFQSEKLFFRGFVRRPAQFPGRGNAGASGGAHRAIFRRFRGGRRLGRMDLGPSCM